MLKMKLSSVCVMNDARMSEWHYCMNKGIDEATVAFERTLAQGAPADPCIETESIPHCFLPPSPLTPSPQGLRGEQHNCPPLGPL